MTDRLKDWLTGQQTETDTNWPTYWLTPTDRLTDANWPTDWLTDRKSERPTDQLNQTNLLCPQRRSTTVSLET